MPENMALLNEFVAACLDFGQQQLRVEGKAPGTVHFGYAMDGEAGEPNIRQYELMRLGTDDEEQEVEKVKGYARKSGAQAVCMVMDLGTDSGISHLFPDCDGVLVAAAVSPDGEIGVIRPYRKSGRKIELGDPRIVDCLPITLLDGIF